MNLKAQIELRCSGTSEGVTKSWDTRGRHQEYGNFRPGLKQTGGTPFHSEQYSANNTGVTLEQDGTGKGRVYEGSLTDRGNQVYEGPEQNARSFMANRYGIGQEWEQGVGTPGMPHQPYRAVQGSGTSEGVRKEWQSRGYGRGLGTGVWNEFKNQVPAKEWKKIQRKTGMRGQAAGGQTDSSSFIGRKYTVQDTKYGHLISEHDDPESAEKAALARPYSKVTSRPLPEFDPRVRDIARQRLVKSNPDIDCKGGY